MFLALLTGQRVAFLSHQQPLDDLCALVAACALLCRPLDVLPFVKPYVPLAHVNELLALPGYVAGFSNPIVAMHKRWWDVLVDVNTGVVSLSGTSMPTPPEPSQSASGVAAGRAEDAHWTELSLQPLDSWEAAFAQEVVEAAGQFHRDDPTAFVQVEAGLRARFEAVTRHLLRGHTTDSLSRTRHQGTG